MAQLYHSFGANLTIHSWRDQYSSSNSKNMLYQTSLSYFPRLNIMEGANSSVSVGVPVGIGLGIVSNSYGDAGVVFAYYIPVVLDYNIGLRSNFDNENNFGGYFGLGFGYTKLNVSKSTYSNFNGSSIGPIFRGGVRIGSSNESWSGHGLTIGLFYKLAVDKNKMNSFGFNVLYDL